MHVKLSDWCFSFIVLSSERMLSGKVSFHVIEFLYLSGFWTGCEWKSGVVLSGKKFIHFKFDCYGKQCGKGEIKSV